MRRIVLACLALLASVEAATPVVRGKRKLEDAFVAALGPIVRGRESRIPVAVVVDVTPYTADDEGEILRALQRLEPRFPQVSEFRLARLGERLPTNDVFAKPTRVDSTIPALLRTLRSFTDPGGAVLFLADWNFEDDEDLESFIRLLRRRGQRFSVVGSEACFGRPWNDGFFPPHRDTNDLYDRQVGRNAFAPRSPGVPWHGGDTAFTHLPFHLHGILWQMRFPVQVEPLRTWEDVRERLGSNAVDRSATETYSFPLPSSFGPYGLMRAAAETGGRYVLWSWNPKGRGTVRYEYARCDLFAPDLRSRREILADLRRRPLARDLMRAWHLVANEKLRIAAIQPPFERDGWTPVELTESRGQGLWTSWSERREHARTLEVCEQMIAALDEAIRILDGAVAKGARDPVDRRFLADAELFRHTLLVHRFTTGEALAVARGIPGNAWKDKTRIPALDFVVWIREEHVRGAIEPELVELHQRELAVRLIGERRRFLARYRATPFGELVSRNRVNTARPSWHERGGSGRSGKNAPANSDGERGPKTRPGGVSGGSGPTTGGR